MAIMHRNPMPLSGALFVTNPRRRKNSRKRKNGVQMRRNALAQRRNALAKLRQNSGKKRNNPKRRRRNGNWATPLREEYMKLTGKSFAKSINTKAKMEKAIADAKAKGKSKSSSTKSAAKARKQSDWNKFLKKIRGLSLTNAQVKTLYAKYKNDKSGTSKKITALKSKVKSKGRSIKYAKPRSKVIGRRFLRKGKEALEKSGEFVLNPFKKINPRRRRNSALAIQPLAVGLTAVDNVQTAASKIPVVRFASFAITPLALGATVYAVHKIAEPHIMKLLEKDLQVQKIPVIKETLKFPYTTTGVVAGLALGILAKNNIINANAASMVAASAVSVGIGLDLSLRSFAKAATEVASAKIADAEAVIAADAAEVVEEQLSEAGIAPVAVEATIEDEATLAGLHHMGAIHQNPHCYGDGGQYMIGRSSQALGNYGALQMGALHMGGMHMGGMHLGSATGLVDKEYKDASPADAKACTIIMTPDEVAAAKAGRAAFARKFPSAPRNMKRKQNLMSRHAGRAGHRFGWLIKMIGFGNFQKIASLPPKRRATVISQLQKQAIASIPALIQAQQQENASLETASLPVSGTMNGVQGFQGVGYGALMFAGSGY